MVITDTLLRAIAHYGTQNQKEMCIEECAELIDALQKEKRGRVTDADVITEIADVYIMSIQLAWIYGYQQFEEEVERKIQRLKERINNDK